MRIIRYSTLIAGLAGAFFAAFLALAALTPAS